MALSAAAVQAAAQVVFNLAGQVLKILQSVSKAHLQRKKELELLQQLQLKLQSRSSIRPWNLHPPEDSSACSRQQSLPTKTAVGYTYMLMNDIPTEEAAIR